MIIIKITDVPRELYTDKIRWDLGEILHRVGNNIRDAVNSNDAAVGHLRDSGVRIGTWAIEECRECPDGTCHYHTED